MIGTILNAACIVTGGLAGLTVARRISPLNQRRLKVLLGAFTVYVGLSLAWGGLHGPFWQGMKQCAIVLLALIAGKLAGRGLRIQSSMNRLGQYAKARIGAAQSTLAPRLGEGFVTGTVLYCVGPLAVLGALQDGLRGDFRLLVIKGVMDGLATMAFVPTFGWGVILSALPVVAYQGTLTLGARVLAPYLEDQALLDAVQMAGGFIVCAVSLVILELKKVPLADYLPSLVLAPLFTWLTR